MLPKENSRRLSTYQFFEIVQIEYICATLRARIYLRPKDKEYWNRVANGKRQVIEDISSRNHDMPTIFTDSDLMAALERRVYRENTFPLFVYKNEEHKLSQEYLDLLNYYSKGSEIRFETDGIQYIGIIKKYKPFDKNITITLIGTEEEMDIEVDRVARIL